jgi:hypothetical protein
MLIACLRSCDLDWVVLPLERSVNVTGSATVRGNQGSSAVESSCLVSSGSRIAVRELSVVLQQHRPEIVATRVTLRAFNALLQVSKHLSLDSPIVFGAM